MVWAHSRNTAGRRHELVDHLQSVARRAALFADKWNAGEIAYWAGLWHDLGKFNPAFQVYLKACEEDPDGRHARVDHSSAGAVFAAQFWDALGFPLAFPLAGHHSGLADLTDLKQRLHEKARAPEVQEALERARQAIAGLEPGGDASRVFPSWAVASELSLEFFLRLLFSALVDADFLDTEQHFEPEKANGRAYATGLEALYEHLLMHQARISGRKDDDLNRARHEIYQACLAAADEPPGIFRLTVPTGGGKTLSGMAFALKHAIRYGLERVIVAIPYTSIIEQTADVYRSVFGDAVLEHHSALTLRDIAGEPSEAEIRAQLAAENWDAPIVVTTAVQLFESLFADRPARCRKLHNVARSVLILDEVQTLPVELLAPILNALQELCDHYGTTVVLCTATQPALDESPHLKGLRNVREIIPAPARYFDTLKRVRYELPAEGEQWSWEQVAAEMRRELQCLAVVNTKKDARALLEALDDPQALHLSTALCGAHRRWVIKEVRRRLQDKEPCRLVATQVIEAGVDLDFPVVFRAVGPLDRIVQAAGRCNREGRLIDKDGNPTFGRVVVFVPAEGGAPRGPYRSGIEEAAALLREKGADLHNPALYERYFRRLYQVTDTDTNKIQDLRRHWRFATVADKFRMIPNHTVTVVVRPPAEVVEEPVSIDEMLTQIRFRGVTRDIMRRLQPYLVSVYAYEVARLERDGLLMSLSDGLYEWLGGYDRVVGLHEGPRNPDDLVV